MKMHHIILGRVLGSRPAAFTSVGSSSLGAEEAGFDQFIGAAPEAFADPAAAIAAFKAQARRQ